MTYFELSEIIYFFGGSHIVDPLLSYDVASGSEITPRNKIDKPLVVYRFSGNVMTSITTLCSYLQNYYVFTPEMNLQSNLNVI